MKEIAWALVISVFLILGVVYPKRIAILFGVLLGVGIAIAAALWGLSWYNERERVASLKSVSISIIPASKFCTDKTWPHLYQIQNQGPAPVESVTFTVSARYTGFSNILFAESFSSDKIIPPKEYWGNCFSLSQENQALVNQAVALEWTAAATFVDLMQ